jgi:hypothetical protein
MMSPLLRILPQGMKLLKSISIVMVLSSGRASTSTDLNTILISSPDRVKISLVTSQRRARDSDLGSVSKRLSESRIQRAMIQKLPLSCRLPVGSFDECLIFRVIVSCLQRSLWSVAHNVGEAILRFNQKASFPMS